jgi:hypothetical protein
MLAVPLWWELLGALLRILGSADFASWRGSSSLERMDFNPVAAKAPISLVALIIEGVVSIRLVGPARNPAHAIRVLSISSFCFISALSYETSISRRETRRLNSVSTCMRWWLLPESSLRNRRSIWVRRISIPKRTLFTSSLKGYGS